MFFITGPSIHWVTHTYYEIICFEMIVHVHVFTAKITNVFSAQNIFLRCPAETSGQNNINQQIVNLS